MIFASLRRHLGLDRLQATIEGIGATQIREAEVTSTRVAALQTQLADHVELCHSQLVVGFDRLDATVQQSIHRLFERDSSHLTWTKETAKLVSRMRAELLAEGVSQRLDALQIVLKERDKQHLDWTKESARLLSDIREHALGTISSRLENFEHRLIADLRMRLSQQALEETRQHERAQATVVALENLTLHVLRLATSEGGSNDGGERVDPEGEFFLSRGEPAEENLIWDRRFGLLRPSINSELQGLLGLGIWVADDPPVAASLSRLGNQALRDLYPPNRRQPAIIQCQSGLQLEADMSDIFAANAAFGWLQEADDFALCMSLIRPAATVIDVGANFGLYAAHAALYAGPEGRVVAFEPIPHTFDLLTENMARNKLADRCQCIRAAVAAKAGKAEFNVAQDSAFSGLRDTGRSTSAAVIQTDVVALDTLPALRDLPPVDLIKIDVEGGEGGVLAGGRRLFANSPDLVIMMEFSHKNLNAPGRRRVMSELAKLEAAGFGVMTRSPRGPGLRTIALNELTGARSENLFLCRTDSAQMRRLQELAKSAPVRTITPSEAAAVALLKRQIVAAQAPRSAREAETNGRDHNDGTAVR